MTIEDDTPAFLPLPADSGLSAIAETASSDAAGEQWQLASQRFNDLFAKAPGARQAIAALLRSTYDVDPAITGLMLKHGHGQHFISLLELSVFARQHPATRIPAQAILHGVPSDAPKLALMNAQQLFEALAALDISAAIRQQWHRYWDARAKGSPLSRRAFACEQYLQHLRAALVLAGASNTLGTAQLQPLLTALEAPEDVISDDAPVTVQTVSSDPGALLFSLPGDSAQVLYRPALKSPVTVHSTEETLLAALAIEPGERLLYEPLDMIARGFTRLLEAQLQALTVAIEYDPGSDLQAHAGFALIKADELDLRKQAPAWMAKSPLASESALEADDSPCLFKFGRLGLDVPASVRRSLINHQLQALEALDAAHCQRYDAAQASLQTARDNATAAVAEQLGAADWHTSATLSGTTDALLQAHRQGLREHARIQQLLGQIDSDELAWVEAIVSPDQAHDIAVAALIVFKQGATVTSTDQPTEYRLQDAVVITTQAALDQRTGSHSMLLYWPGASGGLLRCADRAALEACFAVPLDQPETLRLEPIVGDPLRAVLDAQTSSTLATLGAEADPADQAIAAAKATLQAGLQVPAHAARDIARYMLEQQRDTLAVAGAAPEWLRSMPKKERSALVALVAAYRPAIRASHALTSRDLPGRDSFCLALLNRRLKQDFSDYDYSQISLNLPVSVSLEKDPIAGSGAPGVPFKQVAVPSKTRESLPLLSLLLTNIDAQMTARLGFLKLELATTAPLIQSSLIAGLTPAYLATLARELDLAQQYEDAIRAAFIGLHETDYARAFRRETLLEPLRLMLQMQSLLLHAQGHLDSASQAILRIAIDASSGAQYQAGGHDIRLVAARLTSGGADTNEQAVTLSGITFIEDRSSGITLLYQPDHPSTPIRQYPNLEQARLSLFERTLHEDEAQYLASRALLGNPAAHRSRLQQAHLRQFNGIIGLGVQWPATTSLAQLLLDAQMGRLIEANRASSRSNHDLWLENFAYQSGMVFNYLKMAFGFVPFVGTAIGIYDFFDAAAQAVSAFTQGEVARGMSELEAALVAFIDAAMDLVTGVGFSASGARQMARGRQLRHLASTGANRWRPDAGASQRLQRLQGYGYQQQLSLANRQAGSHGRWRGVYCLDEGNFIAIEGQPFEVQWDAAMNTWRLAGNRHTSWKRAVALDASGRWDTHFALYGNHLQGAGAGGGQAIGTLADTLEPLWPAAIRERLPRWWRDRAYRVHGQLRDRIGSQMDVVMGESRAINQRLRNTDAVTDPGLPRALQKCIDDAKRVHDDCLAFQRVSTGRVQASAKAQANELAGLICDCHHRLQKLSQKRSLKLLDEILELTPASQSKSQQLASASNTGEIDRIIAEVLALHAQTRALRLKMLAEVEVLREQLDALRIWRVAFNKPGERAGLVAIIDDDLAGLSNAALDYMSLSQLTSLIASPVSQVNLAWLKLQGQISQPRANLDRALYALHELAAAKPSAAQRQAILSASLSQIDSFRTSLRYWQSSYASYIDAASAQRLDTTLQAYQEHFRGFLLDRSKALPKTQTKGASQPRVFATSDNQYLVGERVQQSNTYRITGVNGHTEIYVQDGSGNFTLSNPPVLPPTRQRSLAELRAEANRQLAELSDYRAQVERYARQDMDGASLDDLLQFKAKDLNDLARRIQAQTSEEPLLAQLRDSASTLINEGRALHIRQHKASSQPTAARLDYLLTEKAVDIQRVGTLVELRKQADGRRDFMQEFVVRDLQQQPAQPLWYAHFHFNKAEPGFSDFVKAHLKTPAQRYLGREWQSEHIEAIWRGDIGRALAEKHFAAVF
ncbi:dermonecrotic toxin domain-containing protein [Pseudomonas shirazensis]|uniref:dermonecrotic toxin domain-containing protein n=1 Tax=Pseudomonas shirazensis TaxID=2745494 RepID=UPI003D2B7239